MTPKISAAPPEANVTAPEAGLLPWHFRKPVTVVLKYRGGSEGWVEVRARGRVWRHPGGTAIHDVLMRTLGHQKWEPSR